MKDLTSVQIEVIEAKRAVVPSLRSRKSNSSGNSDSCWVEIDGCMQSTDELFACDVAA